MVMKARRWDIVAIVSERVIVDQNSAERQYILSRRGVDVDRQDWRNADAQTNMPPTVMADWWTQHPLSQLKFNWSAGYKEQEKKTIKIGFKAHVAEGGLVELEKQVRCKSEGVLVAFVSSRTVIISKCK